MIQTNKEYYVGACSNYVDTCKLKIYIYICYDKI